jgi:YHS domain-containing protein
MLGAIGCLAILAVTAYAAKEIDLEGIKCVMNPKGAAKAEHALDYKGGKVYFCCDNCPKGFSSKVKTDEKVAAKGNHQLVATKQAKQSKCPFSGGDLNMETTIKVAGAEISFCCENCQGKAEGMEGDKQVVALFGDKAFKKAGFVVAEKE